MKCRACGGQVQEFFSLGQMPPINSFLKEGQIHQEKKYHLRVGFCPECFLVQLIDIIDPIKLFKNYIYFSSTSKLFLEHCKEVADQLTDRFGLNSQSLVVEIASNDGSQLEYFKKKGISVLGVDPAENIAKVANEKGIKTLPEFFNLTLAKKLKAEGKEADVVFGANVLAHVPEIVDFLKGVKEILKPQGTAVFEFPYVKGLMENKFDTIYHEHVFYYSLLALINLAQQTGLELYDVKMTPMQGGSLMIFLSHPGRFKISGEVGRLKEQEIRGGFNQLETYQKIHENVNHLKGELLLLLENIKKEGKKVAAYSAPAKGNILLNYFGIGKDYLDFIVDKSKAKQGLYTPGTHMLVYPLEKIDEEKPDYLLVLCWNIYEEVITMPELQHFREKDGKFIIPIPDLKII